jgi:hypothetical protein
VEPAPWLAGAISTLRRAQPPSSATSRPLENALEVPEFVLEELDRQHLKARDVVWVCRTREHAGRYGGPGLGQPYKEPFCPSALILATDGEPETGYLILRDASRLDLSVMQQFALCRRSQSVEGVSGFEFV